MVIPDMLHSILANPFLRAIGYIYVALMLATSLLLSIAIHQYFHLGFKIGMHVCVPCVVPHVDSLFHRYALLW